VRGIPPPGIPKHFIFSPGICCSHLLEPGETLTAEHLLYKEPEKSIFIKSLHSFLPIQKNYLNQCIKNGYELSTRQGLWYFVKTGYINEFNPHFMSPASIPERMVLLQKWKNVYKKDAFVMIDYPDIPEDTQMWIIASHESTILQIAPTDRNLLICEITEPDITELFFWYGTFLLKNYKMSRNETLQLFDECQKWLEEHMNEEQGEDQDKEQKAE
jgi:hypothetical protein